MRCCNMKEYLKIEMAISVQGTENWNIESQKSSKQTCEELLLCFCFQKNKLIRGKLNLICLFKAL